MFQKNKIQRNAAGIGLIEIMISITVLSIGILGLLQAFPQATSTQRTIENQTIANQLAQEKIENFSAIAYENITVGAIENAVRISSDPSSEYYRFKRTVIVELVDQNMQASAADIGLKKITVKIEWPRPLSANNDFASIITLASKR